MGLNISVGTFNGEIVIFNYSNNEVFNVVKPVNIVTGAVTAID
jgi:hypothetical protein